MSVTKILCVDDDRAVLTSLEAVLVYSGFKVSAAETVAQAIELISKEKFDVLLTDLNIGEPADGFTVVSAMRRVQPKACTFILTGYPDIDSAIQAIRSQVDDYFAKPLNIGELLAAITSIKNGKKPPSKVANPVKVASLVESLKNAICERWLAAVEADPEVASIPLTNSERTDHLPELLEEAIGRMQDNRETLSERALDAARKHGRLRFQQGYTIPQMLFEMRILQQILSEIIQHDVLRLELSTLVPDVFKIGESLQAALETSIRAYQAQIPQSLQFSVSQVYKSPYLGVGIADQNRILDANDALLRMLGFTRDQLIGGEIDWVEMTPEKYRHLDMNAIEQLREFGACVPFEKEFILPNGSTFPLLIGAIRLSLEPFHWCVYIVDMTKQSNLRTAERKVREWEARNALINDLAHEINNPLAAMVFTIHLLRTYSDLPNDARELVEKAGEMLNRISDSVKRVLIESRPVE
jgi:PAS domain S-box-containing protein